jgi:hypothetical protein
MDERRISRRQILIGAGALGALGPFLTPAAARANDNQGGLVRWDLIQIVAAGSTTEVVAGGSDVAKDSAGDTVTLTGSGEANVDEGSAAGGGTFLAQFRGGTLSGVYVVTGFNSFQNHGGSLAPTGLVDGIGHITATTGGILSVNVRFTATTGQTANGVLEVHCQLPGSSPTTEEGIVVTVETFKFTQNGGFTLFHILAP